MQFGDLRPGTAERPNGRRADARQRGWAGRRSTVGAAGWPGLHTADGLSQRSL